MTKAENLTKILKNYIDFIPHSRIHKLNSFGQSSFVKRDDELSFGISGTKLRKYASVLPFLKNKGIKNALLIGTPYSNHILSLVQLLTENQITPFLFLLKNRPSLPLSGNFLLLSLFIPKHQIQWIEDKDWSQAEIIAHQYATQIIKEDCLVIPQGAYMPEALPGAITLPLDILKNEQELDMQFSDIFIESGTGFSAISLILALSWLRKETKVHVVLLADKADIFRKKVENLRIIFNNFIEDDLPFSQISNQYEVHSSIFAPSFGSTNANVFKEILQLARKEGFLVDPLYSAKLFATAKDVCSLQGLKGNTLIIHSGGGLALMGFEKQLQKVLNNLP